MISPLNFLLSLLLLTALAWAGHGLVRLRRRRAPQGLAKEWQMRYTQRDLFNLTRRIDKCLPVSDITDLRALDLIYATNADRHRYVFTAEYTLGRIDNYCRQSRAVTFSDSSQVPAGDERLDVRLAPEELSLLDQYRYLQRHWDDHAPAKTPKA